VMALQGCLLAVFVTRRLARRNVASIPQCRGEDEITCPKWKRLTTLHRYFGLADSVLHRRRVMTCDV
jgi:hypothetical protein